MRKASIMPVITDLFFDLDHTLWDFEKNSALAFGTIFEKHKVDVPLDQFLGHYTPINFNYWELYQYGKITQQELRYGRFRDVFTLLGKEADNAMIDLLSESYIEHLPDHNHLFEGTIETLDYLAQKYRLHIITNGFTAVQEKKIRNSGIGHYFQTITDSENAGVKKPDAAMFAYALQQAGAIASQSIMIGDSFDADIKGALASGLDAIYFNEHKKEVPDGIKYIYTLTELKNIL